MSMIIHSAEDLTPAWFTDVLRHAGALTTGSVAEISLEPVGGGLMSRSVRARLTYDAGGNAPAAVLVKYPTDDPGSLALASAMNMYELEVRFYRQLAPMTRAPLARCFLAELSGDARRFTLVLEDLSRHSRPGDVLTPCAPGEVSAALEALVGLQAPLWDSPWLSELGWPAPPGAVAGMFDQMAAGTEPFLNRFGAGLDPGHIKLFEAVMPHAGDWVRSWLPPTVVQHGDYRPDNLMFGVGEDAPAVTVIDFQTMRLGPPGVDVAYLLGSSLSTDARRELERDLLNHYHRGLLAHGVRDFDFDACWRSYQEGSLYGVFLFVGTAAQVESTERGDRVIANQIRRYADMAIDLEAAAVLV
jgi:hypothetical protein